MTESQQEQAMPEHVDHPHVHFGAKVIVLALIVVGIAALYFVMQ